MLYPIRKGAHMSESMRGKGLGSKSLERETGVELSERLEAIFRCPAGHQFNIVFATDVELPRTWDCKHCSQEAIRFENGAEVPFEGVESEGPRTHFDMVLERRTREELEELLEEMLISMRVRRSTGKVSA